LFFYKFEPMKGIYFLILFTVSGICISQDNNAVFQVNKLDTMINKKEFASAVNFFLNKKNKSIESIYGEERIKYLEKFYFCLNTLAFQSQCNSDYYLAEIYYKQSLKYQFIYNCFTENMIENIYFLLGTNYYYSRNYKKAKELLVLARNSHLVDDILMVKINLSLAYVYQNLNEYKNAKQILDHSIKILNQFPEHISELSSIYGGYGLLCLSANNNSDAEEYFKQSYNLLKHDEKKFNSELISILNHLAFFYKNNGDFEKSVCYFQKALRLFDSDIDTAYIYSIPKFNKKAFDERLLYALRYKAHALYCLYKYQTGNIRDLIAAYNTFELTFDVIGRTRGDFYSEESNFFFASSFKETVDNAIITAYELYKIHKEEKYLKKMFEYSEMAKSSLLLKSIAGALKNRMDGVPASLIEKERKLKYDIAVLKAIAEKSNEKDLVETENKLFEKFYEIELVREKMKKYEKSSTEKYTLPFVPIEEIQKKLESDKVLIEYCLTDSMLFTFVIDHNQLNVKAVTIDSAFFSDLFEINSLIRGFNIGKVNTGSFEKFAETSHRLYKKLIYPVEKEINGKRLAIIQDTRLNQIPFEILIKERKKGHGFRNAQYLIRDHAISYDYSAYLSFYRKKTYTARKNFIAIAPDYQHSLISENPFYPEINGKFLPRLKYNKREAGDVSEIMGGNCLINNEANEKNIRKALSEYKVVHLSGHCLVNKEEPLFSAFVLSGNTDSLFDNLLYSYEIYNSETLADMVVLNGCNTGSGKIMNGEGVLGLARSFLQSGAKSVVVSLWNEDDVSGYLIIKNFYRYLIKGNPKDIAMQMAVNEYLSQSEAMSCHPYFWAGISVIGDTGNIVQKKGTDSSDTVYILLIAILALTLFSVFLILKKKLENKKLLS